MISSSLSYFFLFLGRERERERKRVRDEINTSSGLLKCEHHFRRAKSKVSRVTLSSLFFKFQIK